MDEPIGNLSVPFSVFREMFDRMSKQHVKDMAAIGADLSWWFPKEDSMSEVFKGLVPGRHVFYEHGSDKTLGAIVAKVLDEATGRVNLAVLLPTGMWINMREVDADPTCGGPPVPHSIDGFLANRWRWMQPEPAAAVRVEQPAQAFPGSGDPGAPVGTPNPVAHEAPIPDSAEGTHAE